MTHEEFLALKYEGGRIFSKLLGAINEISKEHIRKNPDEDYRRSLDCDEICIALGLLERERDASKAEKDR